MNFYTRIGVPDNLAITLALIALALAPAPWFGGRRIGPIEIPQLTHDGARRVKWFGFPLFLILIVGFIRIGASVSPVKQEINVRLQCIELAFEDRGCSWMEVSAAVYGGDLGPGSLEKRTSMQALVAREYGNESAHRVTPLLKAAADLIHVDPDAPGKSQYENPKRRMQAWLSFRQAKEILVEKNGQR